VAADVIDANAYRYAAAQDGWGDRKASLPQRHNHRRSGGVRFLFGKLGIYRSGFRISGRVDCGPIEARFLRPAGQTLARPADRGHPTAFIVCSL